MTNQIQFIDYFGNQNNTALIMLPNDIIGIILSFLEPNAVLTIQKLNQLLNMLSNEEYHYLIVSDTGIHRGPPSVPKPKISFFVLRQVCWIVQHMPLLYEATMAGKGLNKGEKHRIENVHDYGFFEMKEMTSFRLAKAKQSLLVSKYLKSTMDRSYISRSATLLSFMCCGFEEHPTKGSFKCKKVKLTRNIILQHAHLFKDYKYVDGHFLLAM